MFCKLCLVFLCDDCSHSCLLLLLKVVFLKRLARRRLRCHAHRQPRFQFRISRFQFFSSFLKRGCSPCDVTGVWREPQRAFRAGDYLAKHILARSKMASNAMQMSDTSSNSGRIDVDNPPFSRVFVVCSKKHTEEDMRQSFQAFGQVEDVWIVKDKVSKESRGVCYIKFSKASSAALAVESMDGKQVGDEPKPLKVCGSYHKSKTCLCIFYFICPHFRC